ncbi:cysteine hydrolase family protein [Sporomusa sp.]|uniref:cysteine hydrolase family protein n=1 Tax=Sporomusa sp. TaxID=2078658 RepID=UPI002B8F6CBB|nr:cysteine hydrolase family protein [Sporomusa sp.]HWR44242.1 cysteine hydrolase family protein [Sporomusa sp.]
MNDKLPRDTALLIIDVQNAIDNPIWCTFGERNNLTAEDNMAAVLQLWRQSGRQVIHVKHESREPNSTYRPGQLGCEFKKCVAPIDGELIIVKHVHSAFIATDLEAILRAANISHLVVFGVITNNSVEATVRMAGNLGFTTYLVHDATFTFAKPDYTGKVRTAEEVHAMSLANLADEYCQVVCTDELKPII